MALSFVRHNTPLSSFFFLSLFLPFLFIPLVLFFFVLVVVVVVLSLLLLLVPAKYAIFVSWMPCDTLNSFAHVAPNS